MITAYQPGTSPIHRLGAGWKILALALVGTLLVVLPGWPMQAAATAVALGLYIVSAFPLSFAWRGVRPFWMIVVIVGLAAAWLEGAGAGLAASLRLAALLLLANLVTLTTPVAAMMDAVEHGLKPFARLGLDTRKVSLAISLALRFVPMLAQIVEEVREAQRARGVDRHVLALAVPLIVRTLKMGDEIAEAIDARGFAAPRRGDRPS